MVWWQNIIKDRIASLRALHVRNTRAIADLPPPQPVHYVPPPPVVRTPINWGQAAAPVQSANLTANVTQTRSVRFAVEEAQSTESEWPTGLPKPPLSTAIADKDSVLTRDPIYNQARIAITSALAFYNDKSLENLLAKINSPAERRLITEIYAFVRRKSDGL